MSLQHSAAVALIAVALSAVPVTAEEWHARFAASRTDAASSLRKAGGDGYEADYVIGCCGARTRVKLAAALRRAAQLVTSVRSCAELFSDLGAEGIDRLRIVHYRSAVYADALEVCRRGRGAAAFTFVGSPITTLCPAFDELTVEAAAHVVLHEALHSAGLTEWPLDPDAPNSRSIHRVVHMACDVFRRAPGPGPSWPPGSSMLPGSATAHGAPNRLQRERERRKP